MPTVPAASRRTRRAVCGVTAALFAFAAPAHAQNWARVAGLDTTRGAYALAFSGGVHYAATDSLVYRSADGVAWQPTATQPVTGVPYYVLHAREAAPGAGVYAGTDGRGVHRTTDGGQTWSPVGTGLPAEVVMSVTSLGDSLFAGLGFSGVYVLNLASPGAWAPYNTGLTQFGANWIGAVGGRLFAGLGAYLFVRERGGAGWSEASWGDGFQRQAYEVVAVDSFLFAATEAGVFRARASDPLTWQARDITPMKGRDIAALAVQGRRVYAGLNQSQQHWIWSSDDRGETWDVRAHEFAPLWDLRIAGDRVWAARLDGLWYNDYAVVALAPGRGSVPRVSPRSSAGARRLDGRRVRHVRHEARVPLPLVPAPRD